MKRKEIISRGKTLHAKCQHKTLEILPTPEVTRPGVFQTGGTLTGAAQTGGTLTRSTQTMGAQTRVHRPGVPRPGIQRLGIPRLRVPDQGYPDQGYHDNRSRSWTKVPLVLLIWWPFLNLKPTLVHINVLTYLNTFLFFFGEGG